MKICFMCDLHISAYEDTLQYKALDFAIDDITKKRPDCVVYAGDVTCDGNGEVYKRFINRISRIGIPFLYIPGNSDLRDPRYLADIKSLSSPCVNKIADITVFALNDCDRCVSESDIRALESADGESIVFMHHPIINLSEPSREQMLKWRESHPETMLFYGHKHRSRIDGFDVALQSLDPDKAIGENPCITYYDTETKELVPVYFFSAVPADLHKYFGISCYNVDEDIETAVNYGLKNLELRNSCINADLQKLTRLIDRWRKLGGENLSIHLPDISYSGGKAVVDENLEKYIELSNILGANRFTQHVPKVSVKTVREGELVLESIAELLSSYLNKTEGDVVIGVENMHMTGSESADETRRFGYIPEECLEFMQILSEKCRHKVGINFDIGHARNNAPFSQTYQIGTWMSMLGRYIVGYHLHQVNNEGFDKIKNHLAITEIYGRLISFSSFFRNWTDGVINKVPVIFEIREKDGYKQTLDTFNRYKSRNVFDIHSHTYYSNCSEDDPHDSIKAAIESGISLFAITDHRHGIKDRVKEYVSEVRALAGQYKDRIKILCGIEIATLPYKFDPNVKDVVGECDFCLVEHIDMPESTVGENLFEFCKSLGIRCGIAHTDLFHYCDIYGYDYLEFFKKLANAGIFWELNVSYDSTHDYREHGYVKDFMKDESRIEIIKQSGVYISVGFDGHDHRDYDGNRVHETYDFLKRNNIKTIDEIFGGYKK